MKRKTSKRIAEIYNEVEAGFDEKATEFLLEVTAERVRLERLITDCDHGHVADALIQEGVYK
jgi:GTP cyclohydrolase I